MVTKEQANDKLKEIDNLKQKIDKKMQKSGSGPDSLPIRVLVSNAEDNTTMAKAAYDQGDYETVLSYAQKALEHLGRADASLPEPPAEQ
jgi:hypothetical protein